MTARIGRFTPSLAKYANFASDFYKNRKRLSVFVFYSKVKPFYYAKFAFLFILLDIKARFFYSANAPHSPGTPRPGPYASIF